MEWWQILWAVGALVLVAPFAYRMIRGNPEAALKSVAGWLGLALSAAWLYQNAGIAEWWEAKHGHRGGGAPITEDAGEAAPPEQPSRFPTGY